MHRLTDGFPRGFSQELSAASPVQTDSVTDWVR